MGQVGAGIGDRGVVLTQPLDQAGHRLAEQGLGLGIPAPDIEEIGDGVEARSGLRMVLSQPFPADLQQGATERLGLGKPPLLHGRRGLLVELARGRHRLAALLGQGGDRPQGLDVPACIAGLPVVGSQRLLIDRETLPGRLDRLGELAGAAKLLDGPVQRLDLFGILAGEYLRGRRRRGRGFLGREVAADQGDRGRREDESRDGAAMRCHDLALHQRIVSGRMPSSRATSTERPRRGPPGCHSGRGWP